MQSKGRDRRAIRLPDQLWIVIDQAAKDDGVEWYEVVEARLTESFWPEQDPALQRLDRIEEKLDQLIQVAPQSHGPTVPTDAVMEEAATETPAPVVDEFTERYGSFAPEIKVMAARQAARHAASLPPPRRPWWRRG